MTEVTNIGHIDNRNWSFMIMPWFKKVTILIWVLLIFQNDAHGKWIEVGTDHFIIYTQQNEKTITEVANRLERFHSLLNYIFKRQDIPPSAANRLSIYVLSTKNKLRVLHGGNNKKHIGGFYIGRSGSPAAFITTIKPNSKKQSQSEQILLHEYVHHYLIGSSSIAFPMWVNEGAAEFFSNVKFEENGSIGVGMPAYNRRWDLGGYSVKKVPSSTLLDTHKYIKDKTYGYDNFYGRSWLLFHKLIFSKEREGQLAKYLKLISEGYSEVNAATMTFGDLEILDKELNVYQRKKVMSYAPIPRKLLSEGSKFHIRTLSRAEQKSIHLAMQLKRGVNKDDLIKIIPKLNSLLLQFPNDLALLDLALEAEYDGIVAKLHFSDTNRAVALSNKILSLDPGNTMAMRYKALSMAENLLGSESSSFNWQQVKILLENAIKLNPQNPLLLESYFDIFLMQDVPPTELATKRLQLASNISRFDIDLRAKLAYHYFEKGAYLEAIDSLRPLLGASHNQKLRGWAADLMEKSHKKMNS